MKQNLFEQLTKYENILSQIVYSDVLPCVTKPIIEECNRIYELETLKSHKMNIQCSKCVYDLFKWLGREYFSHKDLSNKIEEPKEEPSTPTKTPSKTKSKSKYGKK